MELILSLLDILKQEYVLVLVFFIIAVVYSSVGFGGGSSYSAVLSLSEIPFLQIRAISLLCNIVVVSNSSFLFFKNKLVDWKKVFPLIVFSIPFAFLGGYVTIKQNRFYILLGVTLILAAILMLLSLKINKNNFNGLNSNFPFYKNAFIGSLIGFLSGIVGIGGGVFLAPLLHLTRWDSPKRIAATTSFFILVNSISGFIGQLQNSNFSINFSLTFLFILAVFIGGQIGSRISISILTPKQIKIITSILILFVGIKLLFTHL